MLDYISRHFFGYTVTALTILLVATSFYRFVIIEDYLVSYEGDCNPYTQSCFIYCEDDTCSEPFYYSVIERLASEISESCGPDVTLCDAAYDCPEDVAICNITYCNPSVDIDECESLNTGDVSDLEGTEL